MPAPKNPSTEAARAMRAANVRRRKLDAAAALLSQAANELRAQLPGWHVWVTVDGPSWSAVPAREGTELAAAVTMPGRVTAGSTAELLTLAQERYGWHDYCETCGVPARECGHRQPERETSHPCT